MIILQNTKFPFLSLSLSLIFCLTFFTSLLSLSLSIIVGHEEKRKKKLNPYICSCFSHHRKKLFKCQQRYVRDGKKAKNNNDNNINNNKVSMERIGCCFQDHYHLFYAILYLNDISIKVGLMAIATIFCASLLKKGNLFTFIFFIFYFLKMFFVAKNERKLTNV